MSNNVANVSTGKPKVGGAIFCALCSAAPTMPTDATTALAEAFTGVGYISEDGVKVTINKENFEIKDWGGDVVLGGQKSRKVTVKFKMIESGGVEALKAVFGADNVTTVAGSGGNPGHIQIKGNNNDFQESAWVIEMLARDDKPVRKVFPRAYVSAIGEITYKKDEVVGYDVTLTAMCDSEGNTDYEYRGQ